MHSRYWVVFAALMWLSCPRKEISTPPVVDAGPIELAEIEPNDRSDQAQSLTTETLVKASLSAQANRVDEDWYELNASSPISLDVSVKEALGFDAVLEVLDGDRNRLVFINSNSESKDERLPNLHLAGRIFLRVSGARKGVGGNYQLLIRSKPVETGLEIEPNDRAVESNGLALGQNISALLGHSADEDWFRFELAPADAGVAEPPAPIVAEKLSDAGEGAPAAQEAVEATDAGTEGSPIALRVDLSRLEGVRFTVSVLSEAEAPLTSITGKEGEALSLRNIGVRTSDRVVYVVVKSAWTGTGVQARRGFDAERPYTLTVSEEKAGTHAEFEPNDELNKATPLPLNGYREGILTPKSDVDYYVLEADEPVVAKLQLSGVDRLDLVLSMVSPGTSESEVVTETVLLKSNDGTLKEPEYLNNIACQGKCYFKVEGALKKVDGKWLRDFENPDMPYRLTVSSKTDDGSLEKEPNNFTDQALPIEWNKPVRGTIFPKKDVDYFKLDLSTRMVRTPLKARATGIMKVDIGLYLHRLEADGRLVLVQTSDRAKGDAPESIAYSADPGVYILEVRDARNRESNFQDAYQLIIEE